MRTLKDKLSHLTYSQAVKLLGPQGKELLMTGGKFEIDITEQVSFSNDNFQLQLEDAVVDIHRRFSFVPYAEIVSSRSSSKKSPTC